MTSAVLVKRVLVCSKIPKLLPALRAALPAVRFTEISPEDVDRDEATGGWRKEVIVADGDFIPTLFRKPKDAIEFVQATWAGLDPVISHLSADPAVASGHMPELRVARMAHPTFAQFMAEFLVAQVINHERKFYQLRDAQKESEWKTDVGNEYRSLGDLTVGILGVGEIGRVAAKMFKTFGSTTLGLVKTFPPKSPCPSVDEYFDFGDLKTLLRRSDYVCSILPSTRDTNDLLSGDVLQECKDRRSVLLNIGRGNVVSDDALLRALDSGWVGGAVLDVFSEEPLPAGHPFWRREDVVVVPHLAGISRPQEVAACLAGNLERLRRGEQPAALVDWKASY